MILKGERSSDKKRPKEQHPGRALKLESLRAMLFIGYYPGRINRLTVDDYANYRGYRACVDFTFNAFHAF